MSKANKVKNIINKVKDGVSSAINKAAPGLASRQDRRRQEGERSKLNADMRRQGLNQEQIDYYWFVQDNAVKAQEIFDSMQRLLNKLGYFLQGKIQHNQKDGSMRGAVDIGLLPADQFKRLEAEEKAQKEAKEKVKIGADVGSDNAEKTAVDFTKKPIENGEAKV